MLWGSDTGYLTVLLPRVRLSRLACKLETLLRSMPILPHPEIFYPVSDSRCNLINLFSPNSLPLWLRASSLPILTLSGSIPKSNGTLTSRTHHRNILLSMLKFRTTLEARLKLNGIEAPAHRHCILITDYSDTICVDGHSLTRFTH